MCDRGRETRGIVVGCCCSRVSADNNTHLSEEHEPNEDRHGRGGVRVQESKGGEETRRVLHVREGEEQAEGVELRYDEPLDGVPQLQRRERQRVGIGMR